METQEERGNSWPTNFWLVQALLIIVIAGAAFFAGRSSHPGEKPVTDATLDGRPPIGENAMVVAEARNLLNTAITAEGKWTADNQTNFDRLIFNQPQPTRIKLSRAFVQLINTGKLKRLRLPGNQQPQPPSRCQPSAVSQSASEPSSPRAVARSTAFRSRVAWTAVAQTPVP